MGKYEYSTLEKGLNKALKRNQVISEEIENSMQLTRNQTDEAISDSEELLKSLGVQIFSNQMNGLTDDSTLPRNCDTGKHIAIPTWDAMIAEAQRSIQGDVTFEDILTVEELEQGGAAARALKEEYNAIHRLDKNDIAICAAGSLIAAAVDILLVGIPQKTKDGLRAGPLSNYIRDKFSDEFPPAEMEKLAGKKISKVSYDAQDNRNTTITVEGLSAYYHRLLSLGHDPVLGLIFGVADILNGRMTTIDKAGNIVSQVMDNYADRRAENIFEAITKQLVHFKTDVTTSMGLPVPLMSLFNLLQFGSIGEEEQTIAEIVQGMYYQGYDFIHFCSMSIPVMLVEIIVRIGYAIKRIKEGHSIEDSIPFSANREKHPKLATMLFISHSAEVAVNAGKVYFTKNPLAINYAQWLAFAKYSYAQLKWAIIEKPIARKLYIENKVNEEWRSINEEIDGIYAEITSFTAQDKHLKNVFVFD